jgi:hypothetical protein
MSRTEENEELVKHVKILANQHFATPEIQFYLHTRLTPERIRCHVIHHANFVIHRRHCWALAAGQAPLDVKREIWLHEQDELVGDARAGGEDHFALTTKEARLFGVTKEDIEKTELHPFVVAALEAWLHLGKKTWLEAFAAVAIIEAINSNAIIHGGGFSFRMREKMVRELGISQDRLINRNVHVEADQEHALLLDKVILRHVHDESEEKLILDAIKKSLTVHRAYRGALGFAMSQLPLPSEAQAAGV